MHVTWERFIPIKLKLGCEGPRATKSLLGSESHYHLFQHPSRPLPSHTSFEFTRCWSTMLQTQNQCNGPWRNGVLFLEIQLLFKRFRYSAFYKFRKHVVERKALHVSTIYVQYTVYILVEIDHSRVRAAMPSSTYCAIVAFSRKPSSSWLTQKLLRDISRSKFLK